MSITTPTQEGVSRLPTAAHLRTNLLNGNVRIASQTGSTGAQPAVYEITGGSITSNVKLALPNVTADDTLVAQNANVTWGGGHTFTQGLNAAGPIVTSSSISGQSVSSNTLTVANTLTSGGSINTNDTLTAKNHVNAGQNITAGNNVTATAQLNAQANGFQVQTAGIFHTLGIVQHHATAAGYVSGGGHLQLINYTGGASADYYGIQTGSTPKGLIFCTATSGQGLGFFNTVPTIQNIGGARSAATTYGSNEQYMLQTAYGTLRTFGWLT